MLTRAALATIALLVIVAWAVIMPVIVIRRQARADKLEENTRAEQVPATSPHDGSSGP